MAELFNTSLKNDANLVAYYRFEGNVNDSSSGGHNLSLVGSPSFVSAKYGKGMQTALNENAAKTITSLLPGGGPFTLHFWVKMNNPVSSGSDSNLFTLEDSAPATKLTGIYEYNGGTPRLNVQRIRNNVSSDTILSTHTIPTTIFDMIDMEYDSTTVTLYVNNISIGTVSSVGNGTGGVTSQFWIGHNDATTGSDCVFDDFAVFSRALTQAERNVLYQDTGGLFLFNMM